MTRRILRLAWVDVLGVRRRVNVDLLADDPPRAGDWVLVHVGFAMSKISDAEARQTLALLDELGETEPARAEVQSDPRGGCRGVNRVR